ncbi:hypothetical protein OGAPHI_006345 [Ogataea philodendri]|uniref:Uncharacterized protein n=1 Tax=Ogataea philodendri TaxID=1378263 RepID=A0A9P8NX43_9ASCO|nr:uncharacterized protein OGAPHI_006345 [Ogataea philodendri]KAH3661498.1 hypothetical protein OGAPHI_006345 [Ogataea philodendri]
MRKPFNTGNSVISNYLIWQGHIQRVGHEHLVLEKGQVFLVLFLGSHLLNGLVKGQKTRFFHPQFAGSLVVLAIALGLDHCLDQWLAVWVRDSLDVAVVARVDHRADVLGVHGVCSAHQQGFCSHEVELEPGSSESFQVLASWNNSSSFADGEPFHSNSQVVQMEHGHAGLDKLLGELHDSRGAAESHVSVCNQGNQVVHFWSGSTLFRGHQRPQMVLPSVVPELRIDQFLDGVWNGVPRIVCRVH